MTAFKQKFKSTLAFLKPENLKQHTIKCDGDTALLVIDVQKRFADPNHRNGSGTEETKEVSERIASIVPEFRKAAIPVYAVYYRNKNKRGLDAYKFKPKKGIDEIIMKNATSSFEGSDIRNILKENGIKKLLICGFNLSACVKQTIIHARKDDDFEVCLLEDLSADNNSGIVKKLTKDTLEKALPEKGVDIKLSKKVLEQIKMDSM